MGSQTEAAIAVDGAVECPVESLEKLGEHQVDETATKPAGDGARGKHGRALVTSASLPGFSHPDS